MKICEKCGTHNSDSGTKCEECGGKLRQLEEWELPKKKKTVVLSKLMIVLMSIGAALAIALLYILAKYVVFIGGYDTDREAASTYLKAYYSDDTRTCEKSMAPYTDYIVIISEGTWGDFHSIGESQPYSDSELENLKEDTGIYSLLIQDAAYVQFRSNVSDMYGNEGVIEAYLTVVKYRGKWFVSPYQIEKYER